MTYNALVLKARRRGKLRQQKQQQKRQGVVEGTRANTVSRAVGRWPRVGTPPPLFGPAATARRSLR